MRGKVQNGGSVGLVWSSNMLEGIVALYSGYTWGTGGMVAPSHSARGVLLLLGDDRPRQEYRHHYNSICSQNRWAGVRARPSPELWCLRSQSRSLLRVTRRRGAARVNPLYLNFYDH